MSANLCLQFDQLYAVNEHVVGDFQKKLVTRMLPLSGDGCSSALLCKRQVNKSKTPDNIMAKNKQKVRQSTNRVIRAKSEIQKPDPNPDNCVWETGLGSSGK